MADCRKMPTRRCPLPYDGPCGERPCARFEASEPDVDGVWREHWRLVDQIAGLDQIAARERQS